jgi:probable HAF family extracellular repeat protein
MVAFGVSSALSAQAAPPPPKYTITDVGYALGGLVGINNKGDILFSSLEASAPGGVIRYRNGTTQTIPGISPTALSDLGQICGTIQTSPADPYGQYGAVLQAVYFNGTKVIAVGPANAYSSFTAISHLGIAVGTYYDGTGLADSPFGSAHGFLYRNGVRTDLKGYIPVSVNNWGQVVGYFTATDGTGHAFLYWDGFVADLGTNVGIMSINDLGEIAYAVEVYQTPWVYSWVFFLEERYNNGFVRNLGTPSNPYPNDADIWFSNVFAINNTGTIIGESWNKYLGAMAHVDESGVLGFQCP